MVKQNEIEAIKEIIKKGFDLKLISQEFDIPIEKLIQYKEESEKARNTDGFQIQQPKQNVNIDIRQRSIQQTTHTKELTVEEIDNLITEIRAQIEEIKVDITKSKKTAENVGYEILNQINKLTNQQLNMKQALALYDLLNSEKITSCQINSKMKSYRVKLIKGVVNKLTKLVDEYQSNTNDLEKLQKLNSIITLEMSKYSYVTVISLKSKISSKISKIKQENAIKQIKSTISDDIVSIITELSNDELDINKANKIIERIAQKRVESRPKTRFSLTEEQEQRQIKYQITSALSDHATQYPIKNPQEAIEQIQKLCDVDLFLAIRIVTRNLVEGNRAEQAKAILDKYEYKDGNIENFKHIRSIRRLIEEYATSKQLKNDELKINR